jgi:hypothetical protein
MFRSRADAAGPVNTRLVLIIAILGVTCLPAFSACGLRVNVPFTFNAREEFMAAGTHRLDCASVPGPGNMILHSVDQGSAILLPTYPDDWPSRQFVHNGTAYLIFHRYGNRYFLSYAWVPGLEFVRKVPMSKTEKELARAGSPAQVIRLVAADR